MLLQKFIFHRSFKKLVYLGRVLFSAKKISENAKHPGICPSFGGNMPEAQIGKVPFKAPSYLDYKPLCLSCQVRVLSVECLHRRLAPAAAVYTESPLNPNRHRTQKTDTEIYRTQQTEVSFEELGRLKDRHCQQLGCLSELYLHCLLSLTVWQRADFLEPCFMNPVKTSLLGRPVLPPMTPELFWENIECKFHRS